MAQDLFHSTLSRDELARYYSDYYKDLFGVRPVIEFSTGRAALVDLIEELAFVEQTDFN